MSRVTYAPRCVDLLVTCHFPQRLNSNNEFLFPQPLSRQGYEAETPRLGVIGVRTVCVEVPQSK